MATALISVPPSRHETQVSQRPCSSSNLFFHRSVTSITYPYKPSVLLSSSSSSSSSSSVSVVEDEPDAAATNEALKAGFRGCKVCGREELERGCNGEGRIQGGIATVPGFGWWPIKAYRPCPGLVASGGRYRRQGQTMDEVAFGRGETRASVSSGSEDNPSKNQGGSNFKR